MAMGMDMDEIIRVFCLDSLAFWNASPKYSKDKQIVGHLAVHSNQKISEKTRSKIQHPRESK